MTWQPSAVSFSLARDQWSAGSSGPGLAVKGREGGSGWEGEGIVRESFTVYKTT